MTAPCERATRTFNFTAAEVSWVSLGVSPDATVVVFDILGDLYTIPVAGGPATIVTRVTPPQPSAPSPPTG